MHDGLTLDEVKELIEYIQKNNSWEHLSECLERNRKIPKYYRLLIDTRFGDVWGIEFYQITGYGPEDKILIRTKNGTNLKEEIYKWLDEPRNKEEKGDN